LAYFTFDHIGDSHYLVNKSAKAAAWRQLSKGNALRSFLFYKPIGIQIAGESSTIRTR
jgi:hypothetical protein